MRMNAKKLAGVVLCAAIALGGATNYVAASSFASAGGYGGSTATKYSANAYTGTTGYGSVSATFTCYSNAGVIFNQGKSAGGVHGAGVDIYNNGNVELLVKSKVSATHIITVNGQTEDPHYTSDECNVE